jgi:hypothetical protein
MRTVLRVARPRLRCSPTRPRASACVIAALVGIASFGCRDLERFDTHGDEAYCGEMVGAPFNEGFLPENANPPVIGMSLTFDIHGLASSPGTVTTDDGDQGACAPDPLFDGVPLRSISEAFHDPVSQLEFGDGREQNILVWADSTCQGTLVGVLSLMRDDSIEVRFFKPAAEPTEDTPNADRPGFAHWKLTQHRRGCGF